MRVDISAEMKGKGVGKEVGRVTIFGVMMGGKTKAEIQGWYLVDMNGGKILGAGAREMEAKACEVEPTRPLLMSWIWI
jgi:hypothetical protein